LSLPRILGFGLASFAPAFSYQRCRCGPTISAVFLFGVNERWFAVRYAQAKLSISRVLLHKRRSREWVYVLHSSGLSLLMSSTATCFKVLSRFLEFTIKRVRSLSWLEASRSTGVTPADTLVTRLFLNLI
jgi:hypothetical protein